MSKTKRTSNALEVQGLSTLGPLATPRINLNDLDGVRREMARVYKDMRLGAVYPQDGARMVYVLGELRKMFEVCELEKRIEALGG
jgi:hypothetical protein